MRSVFSLCLVAVLAFLALSVQVTWASDEHVLVLKDATFEEAVTTHSFVLVEFYAPWCGHCQRLEPEYNKAAKQLAEEGSEIKLAKVDATQEKELADKYSIRGFPTLMFFKNGKPQDYEGERTAASIVAWVKRKSGPPTQVLGDADAIAAFIAGDGARAVAYVEADSDAQKTLVAVANDGATDSIPFGEVQDASLFGDHAAGTIVIHNVGDEIVKGSIEGERQLLEWIVTESSPLYDELSQVAWKRAQDLGRPLLSVFTDSKSEEAIELVKDVASEFKGKVFTTIADADEQGTIAERWGASGKVFPTAIIIAFSQDAEPKLIVFDEDSGELNKESLTDFVAKALTGEYQSYRKSEPIPENNDGPVTVVVGKNFENIVMDESKNVLLEFYAPWCGHCQKLEPIYNELGEKFQDVENVIIAKTDATANTYPSDIEITGFPTILFFSAKDKTPVTYSGERTLEALTKFVNEHSGIEEGKSDL